MLARLLSLPAGRHAKWLVLLLWLIPTLALVGLSAQFNGVQSDDPALFTPSGAQSSQVTALEQSVFPGGRVAEAIVVYHRAGGLTAADWARVRRDFASFAGAWRPAGTEAPVMGAPSRDGSLASFSMQVRNTDATGTQSIVDAIRTHVGRGVGGLAIRVTGPAALLADAFASFASLDGLVLGATLALVLILLLLIYRSPILPLIPIVTVGAPYTVATAILYLLARHAGLTVDGQSSSVLPVLMFGAGTDYALLLIARYREELRRHADRHEAMAAALRRAGSALLSSGSTVLAAMLVLLLATLRSTHNLGPILAVGVACTMLASLTLLPSLLLIGGRRVFWPAIPRPGDTPVRAHALWERIGAFVRRRPRRIAALTCLALALSALGVTTAQENLNFQNSFTNPPDSVQGFALIEAAEPAGLLSPTVIVVRPATALPAVLAAAHRVPGVARIALPTVQGSNNYAEGFVAFVDDPYGSAAINRVTALRSAVHAAAPPGATVLVGGDSATTLDTNVAANRDLLLIAPVLLLVILAILSVLLRSLAAPLYLIATVALSFLASFGLSLLIFRYLFGYEGIDASIPIFVFLFLVALGVDYNIFLMSRVREETLMHGAAEGVQRGLSATGGIITSAGAILAGTFAVLMVLPIKSIVELGFAVAFGVLLDTIVVRTILVPAIGFSLGDRGWWPAQPAPRPLAHALPGDSPEATVA